MLLKTNQRALPERDDEVFAQQYSWYLVTMFESWRICVLGPLVEKHAVGPKVIGSIQPDVMKFQSRK